jgi:hypothetical protein
MDSMFSHKSLKGTSHYGRWSSGQRISAMWLIETKVCLLGLLTKGQQPKDNALQNVYMAALFVSFGGKCLSDGRIFVQDIYGKPNSPWANKILFPNLYKLYNLYILMDFYLIVLREVCTRSSQLHGRSVKCPLYKHLQRLGAHKMKFLKNKKNRVGHGQWYDTSSRVTWLITLLLCI